MFKIALVGSGSASFDMDPDSGSILFCRAVDPHSLYPDPAVFLNADPNPDPDLYPDPGPGPA